MDPVIIPPETDRRLLEALQAHPRGLRRRDLQTLLGLEGLSAPEMRRYLAILAGQGLLHATGLTKDRSYHFGPAGPEPFPAPAWQRPEPVRSVAPVAEDYPPLSTEARQCRHELLRPLSQRTPVSYRREFLDAYQPNVTYYLPEPLRNRLHAVGGPKAPQRPAGTYARQILQRLLVDLSWASSNMEGNTYSLLDTERLIAQGQAAEGKDLLETQMILNHKLAIEYLVDSAEGLSPGPYVLQNLHALLMANLLGNAMDEGSLRVAPVGIRGTSYIPIAVPQVIEETFRQILYTATAILDPYEQSFFLLTHLPYLQPFMDGNKRTARLAANIPFIRMNCVPITFMDVAPEAFTDGMIAVYETNQTALLREVFAYAYERSCARYGAIRSSLGEPDPFRLRYRNEIRDAIREAVLACASRAEAATQVQAYAEKHLPQEVQVRFRTVVETELSNLHQGNFARYQIRPSEFALWREALKEDAR